MKKNLFNHIAMIPILVGVMLFIGVSTASAASNTPDVAVPLSTSKNAFIGKKSVAPRQYTPATGNTYSTPANGGTYRPLYSTSGAKTQSFGAAALQSPISATRKSVSIHKEATPPTVSLSWSSPHSPTTANVSSDSEYYRTIRRNYGNPDDFEEGYTKFENGKWWEWDGEEFIEIEGPQPTVPLTDMPYILLIGMLLAYVYITKRKGKLIDN